uniref:Uncharacterized protein n=1 Tax=Populus trichocarpa TaxID=3694 RepID=A9PFM4_POPTR|nr:unknown [Populus trichocarpa]
MRKNQRRRKINHLHLLKKLYLKSTCIVRAVPVRSVGALRASKELKM